jgi:hypothetical protein
MYARALPDAERMLVSALEIAYDRLEAGPESVLSDLPGGASKVTIQDPGPQYLRGIADGTKVLTLVRKAAEPTATDTGPSVIVNLTVESPPPKPDIDGA